MSKPKQAILIMAHNNLWTLKRIIELLDSKYFDIFVHLDKKSNLSEKDLTGICQYSTINVIKKVDIGWADYTQVEAELLLLKEATENKYSYYHLISGNDMPIKRAKEIYDYFEKSGKQFLHFSAKKLPKSKENWIKYYHPFMRKLRNNTFYILLDKIYEFFQKLFGINRLKNKSIQFMTGANWFSITDEFAKFVLSKEKEIKEMYQNTRSSDEIFMQTILYNSNFKEELYNKDFDDNYDACKRLIIWNDVVPHVFTMNDYQIIKESNCFFARKFDEKIDKKIIEKIYNELKKERK